MRIFYFVKLQILNSVRVPVSTMLVKYCSIQYWFYVFSATFCRVFVKITDIENNTQPIDIQGTHEDTITGKNTDFHKFGFLFLWFIFLSTILTWTKNNKKYNQRQTLVDFISFILKNALIVLCIKKLFFIWILVYSTRYWMSISLLIFTKSYKVLGCRGFVFGVCWSWSWVTEWLCLSVLWVSNLLMQPIKYFCSVWSVAGRADL